MQQLAITHAYALRADPVPERRRVPPERGSVTRSARPAEPMSEPTSASPCHRHAAAHRAALRSAGVSPAAHRLLCQSWDQLQSPLANGVLRLAQPRSGAARGRLCHWGVPPSRLQTLTGTFCASGGGAGCCGRPAGQPNNFLALMISKMGGGIRLASVSSPALILSSTSAE